MARKGPPSQSSSNTSQTNIPKLTPPPPNPKTPLIPRLPTPPASAPAGYPLIQAGPPPSLPTPLTPSRTPSPRLPAQTSHSSTQARASHSSTQAQASRSRTDSLNIPMIPSPPPNPNKGRRTPSPLLQSVPTNNLPTPLTPTPARTASRNSLNRSQNIMDYAPPPVPQRTSSLSSNSLTQAQASASSTQTQTSSSSQAQAFFQDVFEQTPPKKTGVWPEDYYVETVTNTDRLEDIKYTAGILVCVVYYNESSVDCKKSCKHIEFIASEFPFVKFVKVDIDKSPAVGRQEGVQAVPTLEYYMDGQKLAVTIGPIYHDMYEKLEKLMMYNRKPGGPLPEGRPPRGQRQSSQPLFGSNADPSFEVTDTEPQPEPKPENKGFYLKLGP